MSTINITVDGIACTGNVGQTILEVAQASGVNTIPTLCYLKGLSSVGACRMCVVEVEGQAKMLTACTTPATDGMVVKSTGDHLKAYRREILELLFAGRNHFCMFCSESGDCELQSQAIAHGMDSVRYPFLFEHFGNDATNADIQMDHNRCILCGRCVRMCAEKVGAHTLDYEKRGWQANITTDLGYNFGKSNTCVNCGACAQVCPTGTITVREFVYRGRTNECDPAIDSICPLCTVNCKIKAYTRSGKLARVEGFDVDTPDGGQLCHKGRWGLPDSSDIPNITNPMIRQGDSFKKVSWDEALNLVASKIQAADKDKTGVLVSRMASNEEFASYISLFKDGIGTSKYDIVAGNTDRNVMIGLEPFFAQGVRPFIPAKDILNSDLVIMVGANPQEEAPVVASYIRVAVIEKGAGLINISSDGPRLEGICDVDFRADASKFDDLLNNISNAVTGKAETAGDVLLIAKKIKSAKNPVFVFGAELAKSPKFVTAIANIAISAKALNEGIALVPLLSGGNSWGAMNTLLNKEDWIKNAQLDVMMVHTTALLPEVPETIKALRRTAFRIICIPVAVDSLMEFADVVLPIESWYQRSGTFCGVDGEARKLSKLLDGPGMNVETLLANLGEKLGIVVQTNTGKSEEIFKSTVEAAQAKTVQS